jgi:endo-1,4-beta-D-glucanase Y
VIHGRILLFALFLTMILAACRASESATSLPGDIFRRAVYVPYPTQVQLDGKLDDWEDIPFTYVASGEQYTSTPKNNGNFEFAVAATEGNLYIVLTTPDEEIITDEEHGDSFEFFVNFNEDLSIQEYQPNVVHGIVRAATINETLRAQDVVGTNLTQGTEAVAFYTEEGWGAEIRIPLHSFKEPQHGDILGFQVYANGADRWGRSSQLIWSKRDLRAEASMQPDVFGQAIYYEHGNEDVPLPYAIGFSGMTPGTWGGIVTNVWRWYQESYLFCGVPCADSVGLVFDPSEDYLAVSEGIGYGMLLAVMLDDQHTFDIIYQAANSIAYDESNGLHHWRINSDGTIADEASATDAELDIAAALIFADQRVQNEEWQPNSERPYGEEAQSILDAIYEVHVTDDRILQPGTLPGFDGINFTNPSYFAPAWFRIFDAFEEGERWQPLIDEGYALLEASPGAANGLAPDWSSIDGEEATEHCEQNNISLANCQFRMQYDAIRVSWRVGLDCLWFDELRACDWTKRATAFLNSLPVSQRARLYNLDGTLTVDYQDSAMISMWYFAALAGDDPFLAAEIRDQLYHFGDPYGRGYWGESPELYYNQSLALLAATYITGDFRNLLLDGRFANPES